MANESSNMGIVDEIDRLCVAYDKAKDYISKLTSNIDQQIELWQYRRQVILDQLVQMKSSSSCDFFLPKTQRINDLTIEAVEALCRADLLLEQIHRIDPKSHTLLASSTLFPTRSTDTNMSSNQTHQYTPSTMKQPLMPNGRTYEQHVPPVPVIRSTQSSVSGRLSTVSMQEKTGFKPVSSTANMMEQIPRSTPLQTQNTNHHSNSEILNFPRMTPSSSYTLRSSQPEHVSTPFAVTSTTQMTSNRQPPQTKEKIKLQRIIPGTKWLQAKIDIIDSLSGFYVENLDPKINGKFHQMQIQLHEHYDELEKSNKLYPLQNIAIGDFGVAKYSDDDRWYRARLIMCEGHDSIKIVYVDFGNIEIKSINDFYPLYKSFTDLPAQAIACSLSEAFPRTQNENETVWPEETIQIFRHEVLDKTLEIHFVNREEGTEQWPLHFVRIIVNNQSVTNLFTLQQRVDPRPNRYIAEQMAPSLTEQEYILFNVPISEDD
ncbi:hypothetical protein I4U23_001732 [Adineta vaga]|nr:hypothetical protein I4U23_001732 [Adineta vaga]